MRRASRAWILRCCRTEVIEQLTPGGRGHRVVRHNHVVVPAAQPVNVLRSVDRAEIQGHANLFEVTDIRQDQPFVTAAAVEKRQAQGFARRIHQLIALRAPAGGLQQGQRLQLLVANDPAAIGGRRVKDLGEDLWRQLTAQRLQHLEFVGVRQGFGCQFAVGKEAALTVVGVIHQAAVGPFKVPQQGQGLTHAAVGKNRVVEVEHKPLSTLNGQGRQTIFLQAPVIQCCAVIGGGKLRRRTDRIEVEHPGAQGLDIDAAVIGKVLDAYLVKVVLATVDRKVSAPPVRHPLQMHTAPRVNLDHAIRPAAGRDIKTGAIGKVVLTPPMRRQDRQGRDVQRQGAVIAADDVRYTFEQLTTHGKLKYRIQFADVARVVVESPLQVRFDFVGSDNRTLALDIATLPVLPALLAGFQLILELAILYRGLAGRLKSNREHSVGHPVCLAMRSRPYQD